VVIPTLRVDDLTYVACKQHARGIFWVPLAYGNTYFGKKRDTSLIIATTVIGVRPSDLSDLSDPAQLFF